MLMLTAFEATALGMGLLLTAVLLVAGVLRAFPRATRVVPVTADCPLRDRPVTAELVYDAWTLRFVDVARCSVLGGCAAVICSKRCLVAGRAVPLARAA